jgi:hypothetical protein
MRSRRRERVASTTSRLGRSTRASRAGLIATAAAEAAPDDVDDDARLRAAAAARTGAAARAVLRGRAVPDAARGAGRGEVRGRRCSVTTPPPA